MESLNNEILETIPGIPPIAGFWRRFFAFSLDWLMIGILGLGLGFAFSTQLYSIGPYGRPIGLLFILPYFGLLNSRVGGGQTIGKRWLKIAVRNENNKPISIVRSLIRISILYLPMLFNGWNIPILQNRILAWMASIIVFGLGGSILYTMVFNRKARQGIHDLVVGTYVVYLPGKPMDSMPKTARVHLTISSIWLGIVTVGTLVLVFLSNSIIAKSPFAETSRFLNTIKGNPNFFTVSVNDQMKYGLNNSKTHSLIISVWCKQKLSKETDQMIIKELAATALHNRDELSKFDYIQISLLNAFDIGLASGNQSSFYIYPKQEWEKIIEQDL